MARLFIFAEQIKKIIADGKTEIEVPEGARISAAAADLIKDKKLRIKTAAAQRTKAADATQTEEKPLPTKSSVPPTKRSAATSQAISGDQEIANGNDLSDQDLEALVDRVIERFRQLKVLNLSTK